MFRYNLMLAAVFFKRKIPSQKSFVVNSVGQRLDIGHNPSTCVLQLANLCWVST
jgi:hypothetical protein